MFLHLSVILFTRGGVCLWIGGRGNHRGQTPSRQTPMSRHPQADTNPSPQTANAVDDTHPTGMYSCFQRLQWKTYRSVVCCYLEVNQSGLEKNEYFTTADGLHLVLCHFCLAMTFIVLMA